MDFMQGDGFQAMVAVAWPFFQQWMKKSGLPFLTWIDDKSFFLNRMIPFFVSLAATAGLHLSGDSTTGWVLMIPPVDAIAHAVAQWIGQQAVYQQFIKGPEIQQGILKALQAQQAPPAPDA